jgi:ParB family chromosome partitioning protein
MPRHKGFYEHVQTPDQNPQLAANIEALMTPQRVVSMDIPIERIQPNPFQVRENFADIEELAESMRIHGFTSRLRVRPDPDRPQFFQLVYGERRLRAAKLVGITMIPCDVVEMTDTQMFEIGLIENLQRSDLSPLEEARGFQQALQQGGYSIRSLAERIGKSKGYIQNRLDLLRTPEDVQQMVAERPDTVASALMIAQLDSPDQRRPLIEGLTTRALSAQDVRGIVHARRKPEDRSIPAVEEHPQPISLAGVDAVHNGAATHPSSQTSVAAQQSDDALQQATGTLDNMMSQLQAVIPRLLPDQRSQLLDYIVQHHFPGLERVVEDLRS